MESGGNDQAIRRILMKITRQLIREAGNLRADWDDPHKIWMEHAREPSLKRLLEF